MDIHEKRKQAGLCEGAIDFMGAFCMESEDYEKNPVETINTSLFTICIKEVEKDMFLCLILSHDNLYTDNADKNPSTSISNFQVDNGLFKEEDTQILNDTMKLYYDLFKLFHTSLTDLYERSPKHLENVLEDFTGKFEKHFFMTACGKTYFNNSVYRGFPICPLDSKLHLYTQKYAHSMDVDKLCIFYKEYFVYGNIPSEEAEILHAYLVGPFSERRDGYVSTWKETGQQGKSVKILRKRLKNSSSRVTESDLEEEKVHEILENGDISYEECNEDRDYYTDFCMINKNGHIKKNNSKEGFLLGPSVFKKIDKSNPEDMKCYEIYAPTIFIKTDLEGKRKYHKLVVFTHQELMFAYLLDTEQLEEHEYTVMYERSKTAAENLTRKIKEVIDIHHDNYVRNNNKVKFYYYNETNLAVKYSPSITIDILTTELRHFFNVIKEKFTENEQLKEYKITANSFWIIGVKSLSRLVIILIPASMQQEKMEIEKERILEKYFSQFIF